MGISICLFGQIDLTQWAIPFCSIVTGLVERAGHDQTSFLELIQSRSDLLCRQIWEQSIECLDAVVCPVSAIVKMPVVRSVSLRPPNNVLIKNSGIDANFLCNFRVEAVHRHFLSCCGNVEPKIYWDQRILTMRSAFAVSA